MKRHARPDQSGIALVVVLLLLLVVTLLGLASLRGTLLQERMSANSFDRSKTFQAAEAALREAEEHATSTLAGKAPPAPGTCETGVCGRPVNGPPWQTINGFWNGNLPLVANRTSDEVSARYIAEYMGEAGTSVGTGSDCTTCGDPDATQPAGGTHLYRITVRATSGSGAEVILQSGYEVPSS